MGGLFESPRAEAQPVWERIPEEAREIFMKGLTNYFKALESSGGPPKPPIPMPGEWSYTPPQISAPNISSMGLSAPVDPWRSPLVRGSIPEQLRGRVIQVLSGQYDPRTSPGVAAIIEAMEGSVGRAVLEPMMQRLAMAGQGPGTPMAQATAEAGRLLAGEVGRLLQDAYARELQAALGLAGMSTDAATKAAQLEMQGRELELRGKALELQAQIAQAELGLRNAQARANYELARYGMISEQTYRDYMAELTKWQRLAEMATGIMGAYLPPPQYGPPPIVGILGALAPFLS